MPGVGDDALGGKKEYINVKHVFHVTDQSAVVAEGLVVMIFPPGQTTAVWYGSDTGPEGQTVSEGFRVMVYKANVEFKRGGAAS